MDYQSFGGLSLALGKSADPAFSVSFDLSTSNDPLS